MRLKSLLRQPLVLVGLGAIVAILAPVGVNAASNVVKIRDGNGPSKVEVDGGKLRVGDGDGPITVDGTVNANVPPAPTPPNQPDPGGGILEQGDCAGGDGYGETGSVGAGETVTGVVLTVDGVAGGVATLLVDAASASTNTTPTATGPLYRLVVSTDAGYVRQDDLHFGAGIVLSEAWNLSCSGAEGTWFVYGY